MRTFPSHDRPVRRMVCAILMASLTACTTLRPLAAPEQFIPSARPDRIWVTGADNSRLLVEAPQLLGDTLVGFVGGRYRELLLAEIQFVQVRQPAPRRTVFLVGTVVALSAVLISVLASAGPDSYLPTPEDPATARHR